VSVSLVAGLVGGIGLFLLGMHLMTDGLKLAAGGALASMLSRWTGTPLRGLLSGALITAIVQSSSAVTVATIGFVNAGLMRLSQALTVIYGSNVGTTMTGWLVAILGFHVNVRAFALPAVGIGMLAQLLGSERRIAAFGRALAGFGVFFLGIEALKTTFLGLGDRFELSAYAGGGPGDLVLAVGVGFALTLLMQSSSAAIAVVLTAAGGGALPATTAAAAIVGANVGTTSTAVVSVLGATPNARRVAAGHIAFNVITGAVALLLLPFILFGLAYAVRELGLGTGSAALLALFHSTFNVLGVALMWPLRGRLVRWLEHHFRTAEEDEARTRYLDRNVLATPSLAVRALGLELGRIGGLARRMGIRSLGESTPDTARLEAERRTLDALVDAVGSFVGTLQRSKLPAELDGALPAALRVSRYYSEAAELATLLAAQRRAHTPLGVEKLASEIALFTADVSALLVAADVGLAGYTPDSCAARLAALEQEYAALKSNLLQAGTREEVPVRRMVDELDALSNVRRMAQQIERGARHLADMSARLEEPSGQTPYVPVRESVA
jgi:phosphate:Na+ symporter